MKASEIISKYPEQSKELAKRPDAVFIAVRFVKLVQRRCRRCTSILLNQPDILAMDKSVLCDSCKVLYDKMVVE